MPTPGAIAIAPPDDAALVARVCARDEQAFVAFYRRHARYVAGVVFRLAGREAEVDDLVQEVFVEAAESIRKLRDPASVRSWLATIAVRRTLRQMSQKRMRRWLGLQVGQLSPAVSDPRGRGRVDELEEALERIAPRLRVPWLLHHVEGASLPEVARLCGISLATVKRRIALADTRIQRRLDARR